MKQITILILICTLISGCGIFKKTSKDIEKHEQFGKTEQLSEAKKEVTEQSNEQTSKKTTEHVQEREQREVDNETTVEADRITVDDKGNITAEGGAKLKKKNKEKGSKEASGNKEVVEDSSRQATIDTKEESKSAVSEETRQKDYSKHTVSEPSGKGILYGAFGVLIVDHVQKLWRSRKIMRYLRFEI